MILQKNENCDRKNFQAFMKEPASQSKKLQDKMYAVNEIDWAKDENDTSVKLSAYKKINEKRQQSALVRRERVKG